MVLAGVVGAAGAAVGLLLAAFSLGMARSQAWPERRPFAMVAATAAGYCAFDLVLVLDVSASTVAAGVQVALVFGLLHGVAWLHYLAAAERRPLDRTERWLRVTAVAIALLGLVPGWLITREIVPIEIDWLGVTYWTPQPTSAGLAAYGFCAIALSVVGVRVWRRRSLGDWRAQVPLAGVVALGALAVNDTLSSAGLLSMPLLLDSGAMVVVVATGILHQWRFGHEVRVLELSSAGLEREVARRSQELLEAQAELARTERLASVGRLASGVAHEINNPLLVVMHVLERLQQAEPGSSDVTRSASVETAHSAARRIARIARQLLDAGRATATEPSRLGPILVAPVVGQALLATRDAVGEIPVAVTVDGDLAVAGDAGLLEQVLINLITNAAHALEDWPDGRIDIRADREGTRVWVSVADNGPGIDETIHDRLFEPFVTTKPVGKGSGLGLAVSVGLMRSQNGSLRLVATSSEGTELRLELEGVPPAPVPLDAPETAAAAEVTGLCLLVIDDERDVRDVLGSRLARYFEVETAGSVAEAMAVLGRRPRVDVALCDLMMPDGGARTWLEVCGEVDMRLPERTLLMTGGPTTPEAAALAETNQERLLIKPFSADDILEMVRRVVPDAARHRKAPRR